MTLGPHQHPHPHPFSLCLPGSSGIGTAGAFGLYAVLTAIVTGFYSVFVPEMTGRALEEAATAEADIIDPGVK